MAKRARPAITQTHQFSQQKHEEQFYHSKLLLYYPWSVEEAELEDQDGLYKSKYIRVYEERASCQTVSMNPMQRSSGKLLVICNKMDYQRMHGQHSLLRQNKSEQRI